MANITILEALQLSLNATKKYVDDTKFSKNYEDLNNEPFTFIPIKLTETSESNGIITAYCDVFDLEQGHRYVADFTKYDYVCLYTFNSDNTKNTLVATTAYLSTGRNGMITVLVSSATKREILWMSAYGSERITVTKNSDGTFTIANSLIVPRVTNTKEFTPTSDYHLVHKKYVDEKVAGLVGSAPEALNTLNELATALGNDANFATTISNQIGLKANSADLAIVATSGSYNDLSDKPTIPAAYTHPTSHSASMITGLHTVATSGDYNDLNNKPIIPSEYNLPIASQTTLGGIKVGAGLSITAEGVLSATGGGTVDNVNWENVVGKPTFATVATSGDYNDLTNKPTIPTAYTHPDTHPASMITGLSTVATSGSYADLTNKPTIPTVTNDLTNALKSNYDTAYTHSQSAHAPSNAQKNSDITKSEIEAKLTGNITTHTHSQYLTSIPSEYITEQELTSKGYATATTREEVKTTVNQILGGAYIE